MKKKKIKNLAAVAIALFGFAIIGTNVSSGIENPYPAPPPGGGGGGENCPGGYCSNWFCEACCGEYQDATCTPFVCKCETI